MQILGSTQWNYNKNNFPEKGIKLVNVVVLVGNRVSFLFMTGDLTHRWDKNDQYFDDENCS